MASDRLRVAGADSRSMTLVDSCVILDVITNDPKWADWSADKIASSRDEATLVINPLIYAEISVGFDAVELLDEMLGDDYQRIRCPGPRGF